jgi:hypothetical protein
MEKERERERKKTSQALMGNYYSSSDVESSFQALAKLSTNVWTWTNISISVHADVHKKSLSSVNVDNVII